MEFHEVIIIGGGPAGSSCAWRLAQQAVDCLLLDAHKFPRTKLCAGWITPEVVEDLEMDIAHYPQRFMSFDQLQIHLGGLKLKLNSLQHSIRRYEFDAWLLKRSAVPVVNHAVYNIRRVAGAYIIDDRYRCKYLIGAGGTQCPVYRSLFRIANPRAKALQTVTLEQEFPYAYGDADCHLWFFDKGFPGYSWYVPKAHGYINVGIGGMAGLLKARGEVIWQHWAQFTERLQRQGLVRDCAFEPKGYSYYLRQPVPVARIDNAFIVGDAAGLATRDLCEGIGPAVKSGLKAADSILTGEEYRLDFISAYTNPPGLLRKGLEYMFVERGRKCLANERRPGAA